MDFRSYIGGSEHRPIVPVDPNDYSDRLKEAIDLLRRHHLEIVDPTANQKVPSQFPIKLTQQWTIHLDKQIGSGRFGAVFQSFSDRGHPVAVKKFFSRSVSSERELTVADLLRGRTLHHFLPIYDQGTFHGVDYLVMDMGESTLRAEIDCRVQPFAEFEVCTILLQICRGLAELGPDIVLRDVKPSNILLHQNRWKPIDFSCAKLLNHPEDKNRTSRQYGSLRYMAPEQRSENPRFAKATDTYAVAEIANDLLGAGRNPQVVYSKAASERLQILLLDMQSPLDRRPTPTDAARRLQSILAS